MVEVRVELVYDSDCPNVEHARRMIREALGVVGAPLVWHEWNRGAFDTPEALRRFGSPTVLVDGRDVARDGRGEISVDANACRVYIDAAGFLCGAPSSRQIVAAITGARTT
jgi:mercuric ion transport protein